MKKVILRKKCCFICSKGDRVSFNRPHSLHKTKRVIRPNLQKYKGQWLCTRCLRTLHKPLKTKKSPEGDFLVY